MQQSANAFERHQTILKLVQEQQSVKVMELATLLEVSESTIRNDLEVLHEQGKLLRVHGGAIPLVPSPLALTDPIPERVVKNADQKRGIAQWAAGMIESGDILLLDASNTVMFMAHYLTDRHHLTVFTNGIEVARLLAKDLSNTVILLGGVMRPNGHAIGGTISQQIIKNYHIQTAFVSCTGFSPEIGFLEQDLYEAEIKTLMLQTAQRRIVLLDSAKLGKYGLTPFGTLADIDYVVTDSGMSPKIIHDIRHSGAHVVICDDKTVTSYLPHDEEQENYRLGFANLSENTPFSRDVRRSLEQAVRTAGCVELIAADNQLDSEIALQVADELLRQQLDLVIEYQIDNATGNLIAYKFKEANIPVIAVDIPMVGATYFGVDNYKAGYMAGLELGKAVQERWAGRFDYLVILEQQRAGALPAMRIQGQVDGFQETLGIVPSDKVIFLTSDNTRDSSYVEALRLLKKFDQATLAVVCFNDDDAIGFLEATQNLHREADLLLVGQGADRRLRAEMRRGSPCLVGSTAFHPEQYGEQLIQLALNLLRGETVPPAVYIQHTFITPQNVDMYYPAALESDL